ncbi:MAG: hypothetical protein ACOY9J_03930 [Pseudomonadota bacterium]
MTRVEVFSLALLLIASHASAAEALDPEFLAFLADDAAQPATPKGDEELVAWLEDWWTPGENLRAQEKSK